MRDRVARVDVRLPVSIVVLLVPLAVHEPPIKYVPLTVDVHFAERLRLCSGDSTSGGYPVMNDQRRSIQQLLGPSLVEIQLHQLGDSLSPFPKARAHVRDLLEARPLSLSHVPNWAEGTPLRSWGIIGSVHYSRDRVGRLEAAGNHLCVVDSTGVTWWIRVEAVDVWPDDTTNRRGVSPPGS
jgi:hypothetical protein